MNLKDQLSQFNLKQKDLKTVKGGNYCGCSCYYANSGGSSTDNNCLANTDGGTSGLWSAKGHISCEGYSS